MACSLTGNPMYVYSKVFSTVPNSPWVRVRVQYLPCPVAPGAGHPRYATACFCCLLVETGWDNITYGWSFAFSLMVLYNRTTALESPWGLSPPDRTWAPPQHVKTGSGWGRGMSGRWGQLAICNREKRREQIQRHSPILLAPLTFFFPHHPGFNSSYSPGHEFVDWFWFSRVLNQKQ